METHATISPPAASWPGFLSSWLNQPPPEQHRPSDAPDKAVAEPEAMEEYLTTWPRVLPGL